jgi:antitoxin (DNA-binding transcriptional repressor) of toxin-antitoxin stability system
MKIAIGADEAATNFRELLRGVRMGRQYTITIRGTAVADLLPAEAAAKQSAAAAVEDMLALMAARQDRCLDIKVLTEAGRA